MKILITGATGHAGSVLVERILEQTNWHVFTLERLSNGLLYDNTFDRLAKVRYELRLRRLYHDFRAALPPWLLDVLEGVDFIVHNGAEVHAIRSLTNPELFVQANTLGVFNMLEAARALRPKVFLYTSSAEVFGPKPPNSAHMENSSLNPSNPYAASKAAGEMLVKAWHRTFDVPTIITRTMNLFGKKQQVSKFVPMVLAKALAGETVKVHVGADGQPGTRQWMYVEDYVDALLFLLQNGKVGEAYNIAGYLRNNFDVIRTIAIVSNLQISTLPVDVSIHHKAHDLHYRIDDPKIRRMGWKPNWGFDSAIRETVDWYLANKEWLK